MDIFGIGASLRGALNNYFTGARGTGRTQSLLALVRDGDRVVFRNRREADDFQKEARRKDKLIVATVSDPTKGLHRLMEQISGHRCTTYYDHMWLQDYYVMVLDLTEGDLRNFTTSIRGNVNGH